MARMAFTNVGQNLEGNDHYDQQWEELRRRKLTATAVVIVGAAAIYATVGYLL
ncbi:hypothetical protein GQ53DRAFT_751265 [Thozetella sp. PMI_491]|nr:hypothetical protein GQ53DRAFT_751265 [Thozetella sp. PMI_491]